MKKEPLGKGLSALISGASFDELLESDPSLQKELSVDVLTPNPDQPRSFFSEDKLLELKNSILKEGVLLPILVRNTFPDTSKYQIIAGERRWRAAKLAGLRTVPVIIRDIDSATAYTCAVVENIQRESLNPIEEALAYRRLIEIHKLSQDGVAKMVNKSRSHVTNMMRLLQLPEKVKGYLIEDKISMGHARAIILAESPELVAEEIILKGLSVRQTEALVKIKNSKDSEKPSKPQKTIAKDEDLMVIEKTIAQYLGLRVKIDVVPEGGKLSIFFSDLHQLDQLMQRLTTPNTCDV